MTLIAGIGRWEIMMSFNAPDSVPNMLCIDFESWVHAYLPTGMDSIGRKRLDEGFVLCAGTELLGMLDKHNVRATFFVVSEISEWYPELIEEIKIRGHEIALHSHTHRTLWSKSDLVDEMNRSAKFIYRFNVRGFRAPRGFFKGEYMKVLRRFKIVYDSSSYGTWEVIKPIDGVAEIPISAWVYSDSKRSRPYFGPLNWEMIRESFPFGSPYVMGLLGRFSLKCIQFENKRKRPTIISLHLWQIIHPENCYKFMLWLLSHEILSILYCIKCHHLLEKLLVTIKIIPMGQFFENYFVNINGSKENKS